MADRRIHSRRRPTTECCHDYDDAWKHEHYDVNYDDSARHYKHHGGFANHDHNGREHDNNDHDGSGAARRAGPSKRRARQDGKSPSDRVVGRGR